MGFGERRGWQTGPFPASASGAGPNLLICLGRRRSSIVAASVGARPGGYPMAQIPEEKPSGPLRIAAALGAFGLWLCLLYLALRMPPDGHERGNLGQFLGRLHPLLVHGPVALIALIPFMEIAGLRSDRKSTRLNSSH